MEVSNIEDVYSFSEEVVRMSAWQPIDINPQSRNIYNAILNGVNNENYKTLRDAYDDSPTNQSIISSFVNFMYADGIKNVGSDLDISNYISPDDQELICLDTKMMGGYALQVIWNDSEKDRKILKFEYIPVENLAVELDNTLVNPKVIGYYYSYDWKRAAIYTPVPCKKFDGTFQGGVEIIVVQRITKNKFFPLPDYFSCINYCIAEGFLGQNTKTHFQFENKITTVINFNGGKQGAASEEVKKKKAEQIKKDYTGGSPKHHVVISYNSDALDSTTIDQVDTPNINQQNVFFAEECERKIIVGHSVPKILYSGSSDASGFSSNAEERIVATKDLYRRNINPLRKVVLDGLTRLFKLIDPAVKLEFVDFEEFRDEEKSKELLGNPKEDVAREDIVKMGGPGSGRNPEGGNNKEEKSYSPPSVKTAADGLKENQNLELGKIKTDEGKNLNPSLEVALSIAGDSKIMENGGREFPKSYIGKYGDSKSLGSVYFEKDGVEYRVSNHELPGRRFMEAHNYKNVDDAVSKGESKNLFHKNNVEIIVKDGKIAKINKNFNY